MATLDQLGGMIDLYPCCNQAFWLLNSWTIQFVRKQNQVAEFSTVCEDRNMVSGQAAEIDVLLTVVPLVK